MRLTTAAGLTGVALISLAACNNPPSNASGNSVASVAPTAGAPAAGQLPQRKPGLWTQTVSMDGAPSGGRGMQLCVDAATDAKLSAFAQHAPGAACAPPQITRNLDGSMTMAESCDMGANGKSSTTGVIKGDFSSSYTADMTTQISGSPMAQMNGVHKMVITATWTGPCAPGQRGGDMVLGNGMTRNVLDDVSAAPGGGNATAGGQ